MDANDLERLRVLYQSATQGEWDWAGAMSTLIALEHDGNPPYRILSCSSDETPALDGYDYRPRSEDAWLISELHNAAPELIELAADGLKYRELMRRMAEEIKAQSRAYNSMEYTVRDEKPPQIGLTPADIEHMDFIDGMWRERHEGEGDGTSTERGVTAEIVPETKASGDGDPE